MERGTTPQVVAIGECMLELSRHGEDWRLGMGGDSFNTVVTLARAGLRAAYLTALGDDPFSGRLRTEWAAEQLDPSFVLTAAGRLPGLYAIQTDAAGERSFHYWRDSAAVRQLFRLPEVGDLLERAAGSPLLYLSGITLSLFDAADRQRLVDLAAAVRRNGGRVAFDPNYRPRGWPDGPAAARAAIEALAPHVDIALPTFEDEAALYGDVDVNATIERWQRWGAAEVVVKQGADGCRLATATGQVDVPALPGIRPIDTTGAGDAFNGAYLAARLQGLDPTQAARRAHQLAALVIQHRGAILPRQDHQTAQSASLLA